MNTDSNQIRTITFNRDEVELRAVASGDGGVHFVGHAAVFDRMSHDLGGFREVITPGAFAKVLDSNPDVHLVIGHDMTRVLARTRSKTLELREDPRGLRVWASLDPEDPDVKSLMLKMKRGDIDQMSFKFGTVSDKWEVKNLDGVETVIRTIDAFDQLYEVSVVAQGAYPQTDANLRSVLDAAIRSGRIPEIAERANTEEVAEEVIPEGSSTELVAEHQGSSSEVNSEEVDSFERARSLAVARAKTRLITF